VPAEPRPLLALILRLLSALSFACLLGVVKYASESGISLPEIMFWRQAGVVPIIAGWLAMSGGLGQLRTRRFGAHGRRAFVGTSNMVLNFGSVTLLPLAVATTFSFSTPLFAVVIAAVIYHQHIGPWRWSAVVVGFIGVAIVAQPGGEHISPLGAAMATAFGLVTAVINFQIRDLGRTETSACIVFWFGLLGALMIAPVMPFVMKDHTAQQWLLMASLGILGAAGQLCMTGSLRYSHVANVIALDYTMLVWTALLGWAIWDRLPPATTWIGAPLIIAAGIVIAWREHRLAISGGARG
jgi:drug/metabolite transporter (DMT)-like permease